MQYSLGIQPELPSVKKVSYEYHLSEDFANNQKRLYEQNARSNFFRYF